LDFIFVVGLFSLPKEEVRLTLFGHTLFATRMLVSMHWHWEGGFSYHLHKLTKVKEIEVSNPYLKVEVLLMLEVINCEEI